MDIDFNRLTALYELHYGEIDRCITINKIKRTKTNGYRLNQTYGKDAHFVDIKLDEKQKKYCCITIRKFYMKNNYRIRDTKKSAATC